MQRVVYYSSRELNNGNSQWVSDWLLKNKGTCRRIGLGLAVALGVYILGPSIGNWIFGERFKKMFGSSSKRSDKFTTGLINNRNDCFANSSVQALSSLVFLTKYLNEILRQTQHLTTLLDSNAQQKSLEENERESSDEQDDQVVPLSRENANALPPQKRPALWKAHTSTNTLCTLRFQDTATPKGGLSEQSSLNGEESDHSEHSLDIESDNFTDKNEQEELESQTHSDTSSKDIPKIPLHESLAQILYQLQQTVNAEHHISIWPFLRVIEGIFKAKISTGQNDAHELTQVILQTLEKENLALKKFVTANSLDVIIPTFPVHGSLADSLFCLSCGESSKVNMHGFSMYSMPVPQLINANLSQMISDNQTDQISGYSCLCCKLRAILANEKNRYFSNNSEEENAILKELEELLPNAFINDDLPGHLSNYVNSYNKDGMKTSEIKSTIVKKTVVVDSPDVLILHLSRSVFNGMGYQKNTCNVAFDEELNVNRQIIENNKCVGIKNETYKLKSVLRHQGSHAAGHYECYRRKPDFMKDIDTNQVINKTPIVDFGIASNKLAAEIWNQAVMNSNKSDSCSIDSEDSISSNVPFRSVFLDSPNCAVVTEDDYVIGSTEFSSGSGNNAHSNDLGNMSTNGVSRTPSTLKRMTGFLSRRSSVSVPEPNSQTLATPNSVAMSVSASGPSIISNNSPILSPPPAHTGNRSRFNSISSMKTGRSMSITSSNGSIDSSTDQVTNTSTTEVDTETEQEGALKKTRKRRLKKLKSVVKYPWWRISDTKVKECRVGDVLAETRFVYMLYYEKVQN